MADPKRSRRVHWMLEPDSVQVHLLDAERELQATSERLGLRRPLIDPSVIPPDVPMLGRDAEPTPAECLDRAWWTLQITRDMLEAYRERPRHALGLRIVNGTRILGRDLATLRRAESRHAARPQAVTAPHPLDVALAALEAAVGDNAGTEHIIAQRWDLWSQRLVNELESDHVDTAFAWLWVSGRAEDAITVRSCADRLRRKLAAWRERLLRPTIADDSPDPRYAPGLSVAMKDGLDAIGSDLDDFRIRLSQIRRVGVAMASEAERQAASARGRQGAAERHGDTGPKREAALQMRQAHPEWSQSLIARKLGVNRSSVSRWLKSED